MDTFVVKILASLLIIVLITSNVVVGKLSTESKTGKNGRTLSIKNSTKEENKHYATGNRRSLQNVFKLPDAGCYQQFFASSTPPTGLRGLNNANIKYICQTNKKQTKYFYSTMFDQGQGIAVVAAYRLGPLDVAFQKRQTFTWDPTPGIDHQGSDIIYGNKNQLNPDKFQKGHLISKRTFSSDIERCESTYTYTNAVPQAPKFNNDGWKEYEIRIRRYAREVCTVQQQQQQQQQQLQQGQQQQQQQQPFLYLLTGTSSVGINQNNPPDAIPNLTVDRIGDFFHGEIDIPNSMWTAGCCVRPHGQRTESFAVIGNNVNDKQATLTQQITVARLQSILQADGNTLNEVKLFPGNLACVNNNVANLPGRIREWARK